MFFSIKALEKLVEYLNHEDNQNSHNFIEQIESSGRENDRALSANSSLGSGSIMVINGVDDANEQSVFDDFGKYLKLKIM
jgi:hypothetical protein